MVFGLFSSKSNKEKALAKGKKLASQKRWSEALSYYEEVLEEDPGDTEAVAGAASCREALVEWNLEEAEIFSSSDIEKAREHALLAVELAGGEKELAKRAKALLNKLGKPAPKKLEVVDEKPKRMFEPSCGSGCASPCGPSDGEEVEEDFEDVYYLYLEAMPEDERDLFEDQSPALQEGFVAIQQGDLGLARKRLREAVKEAPDSAAVQYAMGLNEAMADRLDNAEKHFAKAVEIADHFKSAFIQQCSILRDMKKTQKALELLEARNEKYPGDTKNIIPLLAQNLLDSGRIEEADDILAPIFFDEGKENMNVAILWARCKEMQDDIDGAIRAYQLITAANPDMLDALIPLGTLLIRQGGRSAESAVQVFKHCLRKDQEHAWFYFIRMSEAYGARGWKKEALNMLGEAEGILPNDPNAKALFSQVSQNVNAM